MEEKNSVDNLKNFILDLGKNIFFDCPNILVDCLNITSMQSTSWETLDWKKHKLRSRLLREISITSDMQELKSLFMKVKEESEKVGLQLNI